MYSTITPDITPEARDLTGSSSSNDNNSSDSSDSSDSSGRASGTRPLAMHHWQGVEPLERAIKYRLQEERETLRQQQGGSDCVTTIDQDGLAGAQEDNDRQRWLDGQTGTYCSTQVLYYHSEAGKEDGMAKPCDAWAWTDMCEKGNQDALDTTDHTFPMHRAASTTAIERTRTCTG